MAPRMRIETREPEATTSSAPAAPHAKVATRVEGAAQVAASEKPATKAQVDAPKAQAAPKTTVQPKVAAPPQAQVASKAEPGQTTAKVAPAPAETAHPAPRVAARVEVEPTVVEEEAPRAEVRPKAQAEAAEPAPAPIEPAQGTEQKAQTPPRESVPKRFSAWVHRTFPGHEHAFWGGVLAVLLAILTYAIGFFRVLGIVILVVIGVAIGQVFDGDPKIIRAVRNLFPQDRED